MSKSRRLSAADRAKLEEWNELAPSLFRAFSENMNDVHTKFEEMTVFDILEGKLDEVRAAIKNVYEDLLLFDMARELPYIVTQPDFVCDEAWIMLGVFDKMHLSVDEAEDDDGSLGLNTYGIVELSDMFGGVVNVDVSAFA